MLQKDTSQISQIIGKNPVRAIGERMARKIEIDLNLECGYLDNENIENKNIHDNNEIKEKVTNEEIVKKIGFLILESEKSTMCEKYELLKEIEKRLKFYKE